MKKNSFLILRLFVMSSVSTFAQDDKAVLIAPDNWKSEIIPFPLGFAPSIDFVGIEDLRFSPGWKDSTS
ncbi:MAG: hypothetical protein JKY54_13630 [Flavobacteriales bacterium]|nr:hypothetical protein [Flavobacteriales bacterium]